MGTVGGTTDSIFFDRTCERHNRRAISAVRATLNLSKKPPLVQRMSAEHTPWAMCTLAFSRAVWSELKILTELRCAHFEPAGGFIIGAPDDSEGSWNPGPAIERRHHEAFLQQVEGGKGFLDRAALLDLYRRVIDSVYEGKDTPAESSALDLRE